jgi:uncharacterized damage-inducible protein DinB
MTPEQATFLMQMTLPQLENEQKTTRKILAALPADKTDYAPDARSMTAWALAKHIASSEIHFLNGIVNGVFSRTDGAIPETVTNPEQLVEWYDENFAQAISKMKAMSAGQLTQPIDFHGIFNYPAVAYAGFNCSHVIHHRGQLSTYLRPMGAKVPSIYGGSADEPFQMPATA